jgi:hypothetical protein
MNPKFCRSYPLDPSVPPDEEIDASRIEPLGELLNGIPGVAGSHFPRIQP